MWYPQACNFLNLKHRLHSSLEKTLIERVMQYFKDRTESFDDYYPCTTKKNNCDLQHVYNWIKLFIYLYNTTIRNKIPFLVNEGEFI
jgi:putative transposase